MSNDQPVIDVNEKLQQLYKQLKKINRTLEFNEAILHQAINQQAFKQCLIDLVVVRSLSLSIVAWPEFHMLCRALNPKSIISIPKTPQTMRNWIKESFHTRKDLVRKTVQSAKSPIHLAVDVWTTPSNLLTMAICGQFIDLENQLQTILLALRTIEGHAGDVQFEEGLLPVLNDYNIVRQIGAIIGDNSGTNDVLCRTFSQHLRIEYPLDPEWIAPQQRIRCLGHILNLVVQAFLFPNEKDQKSLASYDEEDQQENEVNKQERARTMRDLLGSLGKLHNIIVHIRSSPQRTKEFSDKAGRRIPLDNRTRWNSWYQMLDAIFQEQKENIDLQNLLDRYTQKHVDQLFDDIIESKEWIHLRTMYDHLGIFASATLTAENNHATLDQILENLDICHVYLIEQKVYRTILISFSAYI